MIILLPSDTSTTTGKTILGLVEGGLTYLDTRTDFWRQQNPMYARERESAKLRRPRRRSGGRAQSPYDYVMCELEQIDEGTLMFSTVGT